MFSRATGTRSAIFSRIGSSARHGRHQGAQKSTTIGPALIASSNVAGSSSRMSRDRSPARRSELSSECGEPQPRHVHDRLEEDRAAHLRYALRSVSEPDRHLDDGEALPQGAIRPLDLEGVALRMDRLQVDSLEDTSPVALEPAGEIADSHPEDEPRVQRAAPGDDAPREPPVRGAATRNVPGA